MNIRFTYIISRFSKKESLNSLSISSKGKIIIVLTASLTEDWIEENKEKYLEKSKSSFPILSINSSIKL